MMPKKRSLIFLLALLCFFSLNAYSAITLTLTNQPGFGIIFSGASGRQFILNTTGVITGSSSSDHVSGQSVGTITITDTSSPASLNILADSISSTGGISVNEVLCSYNSGSQARCDNGGMSVTSVSSAVLKIGLDVATTKAHSGGDTANVTMNITVSYL